MTQSRSNQLRELLSRGGEIGPLIGSTDWSKTPLGPLEAWPRSLIGYASMILELPSAAIIFWGPEQTQIYNEGYASIMGPRHPRYFGAPYKECWPDTYPLIYPWMQKVLNRGEVVTVERTHIPLTRYGFEEEAHFTFTFSPLRDDDGAIAGIFQPVTEATAAVLSERRTETLRALEPKPGSLDAMADTIKALSANELDIPFALIYRWDESHKRLEPAAHTENLSGCESRFASLAEVTLQVFETNKPLKIDDADERLGARLGPRTEPTSAAFIVPLGEPNADSARGAVVFGISPRLHFDEPYRNFLESAAGQVTRAIASVRALQEARNHAEALAQSARERADLLERELAARKEAELQKQHLISLFTQAPTPIAILRGPDHIVEFVNVHTCRVWGREHEEVINRPLLEALPELRGQVFKELLDGVLQTGESHLGKETLATIDWRGDGTRQDVYFNFVYSPLRNVRGGIEGVLVIAFNVTDEVRARDRMDHLRAEAEVASRAKDEFLAMLGHELRNPLAPIVTALQLLKLRADDVGARERAIIERQVSHLVNLVDDLLDVSRIARGKIDLNKEVIELADVVANAVEMASPLLEQRRHRLDVDVSKTGLSVCGDLRRLAQIISNLLTNAAKFTPPEGRITIVGERDGSDVVLTIRDTGIGIEADMLPRIFDLFAQGRQSLDRSHGGLGLGLSIVKNLVVAHGGAVEAASPGPGRGSVMTVRLPAVQSNPIEEDARPELSRPTSNKRLRVLVVDDNEDAAHLLVDALSALGHRTQAAHDGPSALRIAEDFAPDVAVVDLGLPVMDGFELAWRFSIEPRLRRTRLIALTGYGQPSDRTRSRDAGFAEHLVKPVDLDRLRAAIDQCT